MSDSVKKYHELVEDGKIPAIPHNRVSTMTIVGILRNSNYIGNLEELLDRVVEISKKFSDLSPATVFQIASEESEYYTSEKQGQWNNQD